MASIKLFLALSALALAIFLEYEHQLVSFISVINSIMLIVTSKSDLKFLNQVASNNPKKRFPFSLLAFHCQFHLLFQMLGRDPFVLIALDHIAALLAVVSAIVDLHSAVINRQPAANYKVSLFLD